MIRRREFIVGLGDAAVCLVVARAQQGERVRRVGVLTYGFDAFAADLVQLAPDVIVTVYLEAFEEVQQRTKTIPIVIAGGGDLQENGAVLNPAHPEGNATGFANGFGSLGGKLLELLKEVAPNITRVASLYAVYLTCSVSFPELAGYQ